MTSSDTVMHFSQIYFLAKFWHCGCCKYDTYIYIIIYNYGYGYDACIYLEYIYYVKNNAA